ncbi:MAG TPA: 3-oxoacyl-ACP reductase family protein [Methylomirabilota bacterium]|jgi:NAD(P)-dependent dehydrogenase (short-subunit alcohol dehydrogenase family)|nr:3-oxoacyl-ACP reductase family protein [Methylomirabilota bacterium]
MTRLDGRVAIVTGAGQGIGHGVALCLARAGANVVVADAARERIAPAAAAVQALGVQALGVYVDVAKADSVDGLVHAALTRFGKIDILVNNAGVVVVKPIAAQTEADWDRVIDVNLKGVFLCCHRVVREMIKQHGGAIVNIASIAAFHYTVPHVPYAASKAGVVALTRDLAYEVARHGVRVNAIAPGPIETPMMGSALTSEQKEAYAKSIPLGRLGQPQDIGNAVVFLASDEASFITGATLPVSGGTDLRVTNA